MIISRRTCLQNLTALGLTPLFGWEASSPTGIMKRPVPSTGEMLPVIGLGTWQTFDVGQSSVDLQLLRQVLKGFIEHGAAVIDSSPMYGTSEAVVGTLSTELALNSKLFMATKVWTTGRQNGENQMNESFRLLKRDKIDLMQIHNLVDWKTQLGTLKKWKDEGRIKYIGITHYQESAYDAMAEIIKSNEIDFIQLNYSVVSRKAEERLLPLAMEKQIAVLINRPFEEGLLFQRVKGKTLPAWCAEFDCHSWGQFFLKFILSHSAVTCVIPGTSKVNHLIDNMKAGVGRLPEHKHKKMMIELL